MCLCSADLTEVLTVFSVGEVMNIPSAIRRGFLDKSRKFFHNPHNKLQYSLMEAIKNGWIQVRSNAANSGSSTAEMMRMSSGTVSRRQWEKDGQQQTVNSFTLRASECSPLSPLYTAS